MKENEFFISNAANIDFPRELIADISLALMDIGVSNECEQSKAQNVLKARTPRITEHALKYADDLRRDIWLAAWIVHLKRVKGHWVLCVGRVEVNDILDAGFWDKV